MSAHATTARDAERLEPATGKKLVNAAGALAAVGLLLCGAAWATAKERFAFSYLVGVLFVLTIGLGALFFVMIQHLARAGWSVAVRRHAEWLSGVLPIGFVLFIPVLVNAHTIWHHWMGEEAKHDEILLKKTAYLNEPFFYGRVVFYFVVWTLLASFFSSRSRQQDQTGDVSLTLRMQYWAPASLVLFGLTQSFAGIDWVMTLDPHWFSTIFGVYFFAGSLVAALSCLAIITVRMQASGLLNKVSTVEHQHDVGKFLFGFTCFWAYIGFSQYFLIWYANIPEETEFYLHRSHGSWMTATRILAVGHFIVPFIGLMARTAKRSKPVLTFFAVWMLCMHYLDLYWLVMPTLDTENANPSWVDLAGLLGPLGVLLTWVAIRASKDNIYPLKDPRLAETYRVDNP